MNTSAISIKNLTKKYGELEALRGIDLEVRQGEFFGLLGPNGAGKTTTINILSGLCNKTGGDVTLFGRDLVHDYRECRRLTGLVPQEFNFDQFVQVKKMMTFQGGYFGMAKKGRENRADELLAAFDLTDKSNVQVRQLSGGMKRRSIIARALMHSPKLLILDEPTAGVDVDLRKSLWSFLRKINKAGTTILLTTHYIEEAEALCDRIAIINGGRIIANDTTRNMVNRLCRESIVVTSEEPIPSGVIEQLNLFRPAINGDGYEMILTFDKSATNYHVVLEKIMATGIAIANLRPGDNRLERVFLQLTQGDAMPDAMEKEKRTTDGEGTA